MTMIASASVIFLLSQVALIIRPNLVVTAVSYFLFGYTGAFNIMLLAQVRHIYPTAITGQAVSAVNFFAIGGTFVLQSLMGVIINSFVDSTAHIPPFAYSAAFLFTTVGLAISMVWYLPMLRTIRDNSPEFTPVSEK
jgi:hypothetical protein